MDPKITNQFISKALAAGHKVSDIKAFIDLQNSVNNPTPDKTTKGSSADTTVDPKTIGKIQSTKNDLNILEGYLGKAEGRGPVGGALANLFAGPSSGSINPNTYQFNQLRQALIGPLARLVSGETGVLNDQDIKRAEGLLPRIEEPTDIAKQKLATLRGLLDNLGGGSTPVDTSTNTATTQSKPGLIQSTVQSAVDPFVGTGKTIGGAAYEIGRLLNPAQGGRQANENPFLSDAELEKYNTDPAGQLLNQAGRSAVLMAPAVAGGVTATGLKGALASGAIYGGAYGAAQPEEGVNPVARITNTATGALEGAATAAVTYGVIQAAANAGKILHPFRTLGEMKQAAVAQSQGATINNRQLLDALQEGAKTVSPTDRGAYLRFLEQAKAMLGTSPETPIDQAVELASRTNTAYTSAGKVGKSAAAAFNDILGKAIKSQIAEVAPTVSETNRLFSMLYGAQKTAKSVANPLKTAALFKALGLFGI